MKHKRDKDIQKIRMCWEIKVNTICNIFIWISGYLFDFFVYTQIETFAFLIGQVEDH